MTTLRLVLIGATIVVMARGGSAFGGPTRWLAPRLAEIDSRRTELLAQLRTSPPLPSPGPGEPAGYHSILTSQPDIEKWVQVDLGRPLAFDRVVLIPAAVSEAFPVRFRVEVADEPAFASPRLVADHSAADFSDPGAEPVGFAATGHRGRYVRLTAMRLHVRQGRGRFALAELMILDGPVNRAAGRPAKASDALVNPPAWAVANLTDGRSPVGLPLGSTNGTINGFHSQIASRPDAARWVRVDLGTKMPLDEVRLIPARPSNFADRHGFGFPVRFRVEAAVRDDFADAVVLADHTAADFPNPGDNAVSVPGSEVEARFLRVTATRLWERSDDYVFALAELQAYSGGRNVARGAAVTASDTIERHDWGTAFLTDGLASQGRLLEWPEWLDRRAERAGWERELRELEAERERELAELPAAAVRWGGAGLLLAGLGGLLLVIRARARRRQEIEALRARIARDLHDEIGSNLGGIALMSQLAAGPDDLAEIHRLARATLDSLRDLVWLLDQSSDTSADLRAKLRDTAESLAAGVECEFDVPEEAFPPRLSPEFKRQVFLFAKEALHNAVRHAGAARIRVMAHRQAGVFCFEVADDGRGFDPAVRSTGVGLKNMRSRAATLGGTFTVVSKPGGGTTVRMTVPVGSTRAVLQGDG